MASNQLWWYVIFRCPVSSPLLPPYIGIAAGLQLLPHGRLETATESWRGGGGSAMVVRPENQDFDESDGW